MEQVEGPQVPLGWSQGRGHAQGQRAYLEALPPGCLLGYDLGVDDDLQAVGVEDAADVHVELVKLVDGAGDPDVPQDAVVQHQLVAGVKGGPVARVVVGQGGFAQGQRLLTCLKVKDLQRTTGRSLVQKTPLHSREKVTACSRT